MRIGPESWRHVRHGKTRSRTEDGKITNAGAILAEQAAGRQYNKATQNSIKSEITIPIRLRRRTSQSVVSRWKATKIFSEVSPKMKNTPDTLFQACGLSKKKNYV